MLDSKSYSSKVAINFGTKIVSGCYKYGEPLPTESEICELMDCSRSVVREGIKILDSKGLIVTRGSSGSIVAPSIEWDLFDQDVLDWMLRGDAPNELIDQLESVYISILPYAASLLAQESSDKDIEMITNIAMSILSLDKLGHPRHVSRIKVDFYSALLSSINNRFFERLIDPLRLLIEHKYIATYFEQCIESKNYHLFINTIVKKDPIKASRAMEALVKTSLFQKPLKVNVVAASAT